MRFVISQTNFTVGDLSGNTDKIIETIKKFHNSDVDLIIFPELTITGYPPEDLLYRPALQKKVKHCLDEICKVTSNASVIVGHPQKAGDQLFNACSLIKQGKVELTYYKQVLPNYSVFDEKRYFDPGKQACIFNLENIPVGLSICEDIWDPAPCKLARSSGAELIVNINASPFHLNKNKQRENILTSRCRESGLNIIYVNMIGGQDELVFDGGSMAVNNQGEIQYRAPQFEEGDYLVEFNIDNNNGKFISKDSTSRTDKPDEELIYDALVLGVRDYVYKNGFNGAIIGLSGGIDSALTLCIATDALGKENVEALMMPSIHTSDMSKEDARTEANNLDVKYNEISIDPLYQNFNESLRPLFNGLPFDTTEENIQSRCRGTLLMAVSNKSGKLVIATGNKSEMAVGYATLYGDMAGGFAPLKDIPKTLVYKLANWRNSKSHDIPQRIIDRPPSAELRDNQRDEDSLPPYEILDPVLERYIELDQSPEEIITAGYEQDTVYKIVSLVDKNEYKRRQAAPGVRISKRAFGRDRRYPITSGYREY